jgi:hypothetical protein
MDFGQNHFNQFRKLLNQNIIVAGVYAQQKEEGKKENSFKMNFNNV